MRLKQFTIIISITLVVIAVGLISYRPSFEITGIQKDDSIEYQKGIGSWYDFDLRTGDQKCNAGDCYSKMYRTCASRDHEKGSILIVMTETRFTTCIVKDYGPATHTGRIIDLSSLAFKDLAPLSKGLVNVKVYKRIDMLKHTNTN